MCGESNGTKPVTDCSNTVGVPANHLAPTVSGVEQVTPIPRDEAALRSEWEDKNDQNTPNEGPTNRLRQQGQQQTEKTTETIGISGKREGDEIAVEEVTTPRAAKEYLTRFSGIKVGFEEGINFGHLASGLTLIQSLKELGFKGRVTLVCSNNVYKKLLQLNPDVKSMEHEEKDEFDAEKNYEVGNTIATDILHLIPSGDLIDESNNKQFLNYMEANTCLVMKPYGWGSGKRRLIHRQDQGGDVDEECVESDIDRESLYRYNLDSPENLETFVTDQLGNEKTKATGIMAIAEAVKKSQIELMPVYGLHRLADDELLNTEAHLSNAVKEAAVRNSRPVVLLMLSNSRLDFAPIYTADWLIRRKITDGELTDAIKRMEEGQVMILDCKGLPQGVFNEVFKMASLPAILEGANTSNLMQLIGKPFMSPRTNDTAFPFASKDENAKAIEELGGVQKALTHDTNWNEAYRDCNDYENFNNYGLAITSVKSVIKLYDDGYNEYVPESIPDVTSRFERIKREHGGVGAWDVERFKNELDELEKAIEPMKATIRDAIGTKQVQLDPESINSIATFIQNCATDHSIAREYFARVACSVKDPKRDQVLNGLKLIMEQKKGVETTKQSI